ncbi:hypothetical protein TWF481_006043 [Arthrobotrys musiformis]|uniref:Uncharacterized protein n=1 Tax=Arthrobotrys musiformis TaxID=47236 RepID=A0AAV9WHI7_9PEZI
MPGKSLMNVPEGSTAPSVFERVQMLKESHPFIFLEILGRLDEKASILAWLAYATGVVEGEFARDARRLFALLQSIADSKSGLEEAQFVTVRGAELPLVGRSCVLAALLSAVLQPSGRITGVPERTRYLRAAVRLLRLWYHKFVTKSMMPATLCGIIRCPTGEGLPMELWLGTTPPKGTGGAAAKTKAKEARVKLAEKTGVWSEKADRFPVGSCAETFPLSVLLGADTGPSRVYSLSIRNKDGEYIRACGTCTATLANVAHMPGFTALDMSLPAVRWMYGEGVEEGVEEGVDHEEVEDVGGGAGRAGGGGGDGEGES